MDIVHRNGSCGPDVLACAQGGCRACLDAVIRQNEGLIHAVLRRTQRGEAPYEELVQEGRIALWQAACRFDRQRGVAFSTYAWIAIEHQVHRAVARARGVEGHLELGDPAGLLEAVELEVWRSQVRRPLEQALARLPAHLREVVLAVYGLNGAAPCTMAAVGRRRGISGERVRQLRNDALVLLRLPALAGPLHQMCGQNTRQDQARLLAMNRAWLRRGRRGRS